MKFAAIQEEKANYPVALLCRVLEVSRAGYYAWEGREVSARQKANAALKERIQQVHQESRRTYGSPRVRAELKAQGQHVGLHRVARLMREAGLRARRRRRFVHTTDSKHGLPVAPNVLARDFNPPKPDRAWVTDITYIPTREGWVYLAVVLDLFSRRVVGWAMDRCIDRHLVLLALDMALKGRCPPTGLLHHSDRGSHPGHWRHLSAAFSRQGIRPPGLGLVGRGRVPFVGAAHGWECECLGIERRGATPSTSARGGRRVLPAAARCYSTSSRAPFQL